MTDSSGSSRRPDVLSVIRQPLSIAIAAAAGITLLLAIALLTIWSTDANSDDRPPSELAASMLTAESGENAPTPTPRVLATRPPASPVPTVAGSSTGSIAATTPTPPATDVAATEPAATTVPATATAPSVPVIVPGRATTTTSFRPSIRPPARGTAEAESLYLAEDRGGFTAWAVNAWTIAENQLVNEGTTVISEPWAIGPYRPDDDNYALEAEIRVRGLAPNVCDQNFGLVAGPEGNGVVWGGGVIFNCPASEPHARITDVAYVGDGYNQDRQIATGAFDPGDAWHTYRLEVRGQELTLLVDGEEVASGTDPTALAPARSSQIGIWSQGVRLSVRRLAVYPLDNATG